MRAISGEEYDAEPWSWNWLGLLIPSWLRMAIAIRDVDAMHRAFERLRLDIMKEEL